MKFKSLVLFLMVSASMNLLGQISGYMGKRFSIGYSNYSSPSFINPSATVMDGLGINTTHCGNIEYSLSNKTNMCVGVQFSKTGIKAKDSYYYLYTPPFSSSSTTEYAYYNPLDKKPIQLKSTNISLGFKFFRSGWIAPVGKYVKLDFILLLHNVSYDKTAFYFYDYSSSGEKIKAVIGKGEYQYKTFALGYTIGRNRVLFNKLILDSGIRFGLSTNGVVNSILGDLGSTTNGFETELKRDTSIRILYSQLVNFHIGLGFLAF